MCLALFEISKCGVVDTSHRVKSAGCFRLDLHEFVDSNQLIRTAYPVIDVMLFFDERTFPRKLRLCSPRFENPKRLLSSPSPFSPPPPRACLLTLCAWHRAPLLFLCLPRTSSGSTCRRLISLPTGTANVNHKKLSCALGLLLYKSTTNSSEGSSNSGTFPHEEQRLINSSTPARTWLLRPT